MTRRATAVSLLLGLLMLGSAAATRMLTPSVRMADTRQRFSLERMIPASFGDWRIDTTLAPLRVDPATQARLDRIYNQTLARTYVNRAGQRVMLSLAYGGDQDDNTGLHRPELCYAAQGFELRRDRAGRLATRHGTLPVRRLLAVNGARSEPITYWITVGDEAIRPGIEQKLRQLRFGLGGTVPDGMLVRVSSLDADADAAYLVQARFVDDLLDALNPAARKRLAGAFGA